MTSFCFPAKVCERKNEMEDQSSRPGEDNHSISSPEGTALYAAKLPTTPLIADKRWTAPDPIQIVNSQLLLLNCVQRA